MDKLTLSTGVYIESTGITPIGNSSCLFLSALTYPLPLVIVNSIYSLLSGPPLSVAIT